MSTSWHKNAIALTGTIGSGKSEVARIFRQLGAYTASADDFARQAVAPGSPALAAIAREFGPEVIQPDGSLDRKQLGQIVFSNPEKRKALEAITHPEIRALAKSAFERAAAEKHSVLVYECPLLFEAGLDAFGFKKIVLVTAPREQCLERIAQRDKVSIDDAAKRIAAQFPVEEKLRRSDIIIDNSGSRQELEEKVKNLFDQLREETIPV